MTPSTVPTGLLSPSALTRITRPVSRSETSASPEARNVRPHGVVMPDATTPATAGLAVPVVLGAADSLGDAASDGSVPCGALSSPPPLEQPATAVTASRDSS